MNWGQKRDGCQSGKKGQNKVVTKAVLTEQIVMPQTKPMGIASGLKGRKSFQALKGGYRREGGGKKKHGRDNTW